MSTVFLGENIWSELTKAARSSRQPCDVAVAYFGQGASRLLPLRRGSRLVVDASERAVAGGQTCPRDLQVLMKRGVIIYSVPNLHAKVFVFGRACYVGSTNVSSRSAAQLVEAVIGTTESSAVKTARQFVRDNCLHQLTPTVLERLAKLYRPPQIPGGKRGKRASVGTAKRPTLPRLLLAQLRREDWSARDWEIHDVALAVARKRRQHPRNYGVDSFRYPGKCPFQRGDKVIQVVDEDGGRIMVSPPGNVLHVRRDGKPNGQVSFVYLELPVLRRRRIDDLAKGLGQGSRQKLRRQGIVRNVTLVRDLLSLWATPNR